MLRAMAFRKSDKMWSQVVVWVAIEHKAEGKGHKKAVFLGQANTAFQLNPANQSQYLKTTPAKNMNKNRFLKGTT